jgi:hypothetical protein
MPNDETESSKLRRYHRLTDDQKIFHAKKILSEAPSDPRDWGEKESGVAYVLAKLSEDRRDYLVASDCRDRLLTYLIAQSGVGDEGDDVLPSTVNAGRLHWALEDSLGVASVMEPVYNYWISSDENPRRSSQRHLAKMAGIYMASGWPRQASRLNKRVLRASLRYGNALRFLRSLCYQIPIGVTAWAVKGRPDLEGRMRRPWRRHWPQPRGRESPPDSGDRK